jgi:hypothetical protein
MKVRTLTERQLRSSWGRLLELQKHGYELRLKRRGKVVAQVVPSRPTMSSRLKHTQY